MNEVPTDLETGRSLIAAWRTNNRVTVYLIGNLPPAMWSRAVPGFQRGRAHDRGYSQGHACWIKMRDRARYTGAYQAGGSARVRASELLPALRDSDGSQMLELGIDQVESFQGLVQNLTTISCTFQLLRRRTGTLVAGVMARRGEQVPGALRQAWGNVEAARA